MINPNGILLISVVAIVLGCSSNNESLIEQNDAEPSLLDSVWELTQFTDEANGLNMIADETIYQLRLDSQTNTLDFFAGCVNYAGGLYELNDGFFTLDIGSRDAVMCQTDKEQYTSQHRAITNLIAGNKDGSSLPLMFFFAESSLKLSAAEGHMLVFEERAEMIEQGSVTPILMLDDTVWIIDSFTDSDGTQHSIPFEAYWRLGFHRDDDEMTDFISVNTALCRGFAFYYDLNISSIMKSDLIFAEGGCTGDSSVVLLDLEDAVTQAFIDSSQFAVKLNDEGRLIITTEFTEVIEAYSSQ